MSQKHKLVYNYRSGETPEERLRNKLQPLFSLVNTVATGEKVSKQHIDICVSVLPDIKDLLDDMSTFYIVNSDIKFTQTDTLG